MIKSEASLHVRQVLAGQAQAQQGSVAEQTLTERALPLVIQTLLPNVFGGSNCVCTQWQPEFRPTPISKQRQ